MKKILFIIIGIFAVPLITFSHSGGTDSFGGHYCWTNCYSQGYYYGEYHFHNNNIFASSCFLPYHSGCSSQRAVDSVESQCSLQNMLNSIQGGGGTGLAHSSTEDLCYELLDKCKVEFDDYNRKWNEYYQCIDNEKAEQTQELLNESELITIGNNTLFCPLSVPNSHYNESLDSCICNEGYKRYYGKCVWGESHCTDLYGQYSIFKDGDCTCMDKYGFDLNKTKCELGDYYKNKSKLLVNNPLNLQSDWLVKSLKHAEVFSVDKNLCFHWVINEEVAEKHFGITWNYEGNIKEYENLSKHGYKFCNKLE